jgi:hypothetical protein
MINFEPIITPTTKADNGEHDVFLKLSFLMVLLVEINFRKVHKSIYFKEEQRSQVGD